MKGALAEVDWGKGRPGRPGASGTSGELKEQPHWRQGRRCFETETSTGWVRSRCGREGEVGSRTQKVVEVVNEAAKKGCTSAFLNNPTSQCEQRTKQHCQDWLGLSTQGQASSPPHEDVSQMSQPMWTCCPKQPLVLASELAAGSEFQARQAALRGRGQERGPTKGTTSIFPTCMTGRTTLTCK